ncbi:MAG: hypothetical protein ACI85O_003343 [Saprospiraceae bacterium]|jgi:hypothetical protein
MSIESLKKEISLVLYRYEIKNIEPIIYILSSYNSIYQIEKDLEVCNKILLKKSLTNWQERFLHCPFQDCEVMIEPEEDIVSISLIIFDNSEVDVPIRIYKSLLELVFLNFELHGSN